MTSASESHDPANLRMTREHWFMGLAEVARSAQGSPVAINVSRSVAFGCPMVGDAPEGTVLGCCSRCRGWAATPVSTCTPRSSPPGALPALMGDDTPAG